MAQNDTNATPHEGVDQATGTEFVGHEWDGIAELNTPLPRWWLWSFYATIIWGIVYVILYPAWPLVSSATEGVLGWTSRGALEKELQAANEQRAPIFAALADVPVSELPGDDKLMKTAIEGGRAAFKVHCVQCHGSGAAGFKGYPNLNDDDWLWGGDMEAIHYSLTHGIRNPDHAETRQSQMPAFGEILSTEEIGSLATHVLSLSGKAKPSPAGAALYAQNCSVCHGDNGKGIRDLGAPNLSDTIWLYGGERSDVMETIRYSRQGVMPRWNDKLDPVTIKMLTAYVWSRGGGEQPKLADAEETGDQSPVEAEAETDTAAVDKGAASAAGSAAASQ